MPMPLSPNCTRRVPRGTYHAAMRDAQSSEAYAPAEQPVTRSNSGEGSASCIQSMADWALTAPRWAMVTPPAYVTDALPQCRSPVQ